MDTLRHLSKMGCISRVASHFCLSIAKACHGIVVCLFRWQQTIPKSRSPVLPAGRAARCRSVCQGGIPCVLLHAC